MYTLDSHFLYSNMAKITCPMCFRCGCMTPISTRPMGRWECALWIGGSPIHFPMLPGRNHLCGISTHRLLIKSGSLPPVNHGGSHIMVWGSMHPGIVLLQVEGMVARKVFSPVIVLQEQHGEPIYRDNQHYLECPRWVSQVQLHQPQTIIHGWQWEWAWFYQQPMCWDATQVILPG